MARKFRTKEAANAYVAHLKEAPTVVATAALERVAEAIYESDRHNRHNSEPWSLASMTTRAIYLRNATAAIKAMEDAEDAESERLERKVPRA